MGEAWWADIGRQVGASERQLRFTCAQLRGCSQTQAAREAGYPAENEASLRQSGYRLSRSNVVQRLIALASAEKGGDFGLVDEPEVKRILSGLARGSDPRVRLSACDALTKLAERERQARLDQRQPTPEEVAAEILRASPHYGAIIIADCFFETTGQIWGLPYLRQIAPLLKRDFFKSWQRYLDAIKEPTHRAELDSWGNGPVLPLEQIIGPNPVESKTDEVTQ